MTPDEVKTIGTLCDTLRAKGVARFECDDKGGVKFEFGPLESPVAATASAPAPALSAPCACGHMEWEHNDGACLRGCDAEKCEERQAE